MKRKCMLVCIAVLALVQAGSYFISASQKIPGLALRVTPEHTRFAKGASFSWAVVALGDSSKLTAKQQELFLSHFRQRYSRVYTNLASVPSNLIVRDDRGGIQELVGGFSFTFRVVSRWPFWVRVAHSDLESNLAYYHAEHIFVWFLGTWVKLYDRLLMQS